MKDKKFLYYIIFFTIICFIIYKRWPVEKKDEWFSKEIKAYNLKLKVKEFDKQSGHYLKISGKYDNNDTLFEYVLYSLPFSLGPNPDQPPIRKITFRKERLKSEDYYTLIKPADSLFNNSSAEYLCKNDFIILNTFDSILKIRKEKYAYYQKKYQNIVSYSKKLFSENDNGLFLQIRE